MPNEDATVYNLLPYPGSSNGRLRLIVMYNATPMIEEMINAYVAYDVS